jgi:hypothetical protein
VSLPVRRLLKTGWNDDIDRDAGCATRMMSRQLNIRLDVSTLRTQYFDQFMFVVRLIPRV